MKILVLGGTQMIGRDFVEKIQDKYPYDITLANRGKTNSSIFPEIKRIFIDRNSRELSLPLSNDIVYDYVFDFSCYNLQQFQNIVDLIKCTNYIYMSTIGIFDVSSDQCYVDSNIPNSRYLNYCIDKRNIETYIWQTEFSYKMFIIRPCIIYGENDYTKRFEQRHGQYYWKDTNIKADQETNCIHVSEVTERLIDTIQNNQLYTEKKNIIHIGTINNAALPTQ